MQLHFTCLKWKHFNISTFESKYLDPSISWIFEAGSCIFFWFNCFFSESPEEDVNVPYFSSLVSQLYRILPAHNSFVMSFPFLPSALGLISTGGKHPQSPLKSEVVAGVSHLSGHGQKQGPQPAGQRGAKLLYFCSHTCTEEMFSGLPALQKAGKALDICLGKSPHNVHCFPLLGIQMFGKEGRKWIRSEVAVGTPFSQVGQL